MENKTLDLLGYDPIEAKNELEAYDEGVKYADESNEEEFVEAGLPYVKLSKPLSNYKFK